jgi:hypothetical protein
MANSALGVKDQSKLKVETLQPGAPIRAQMLLLVLPGEKEALKPKVLLAGVMILVVEEVEVVVMDGEMTLAEVEAVEEMTGEAQVATLEEEDHKTEVVEEEVAASNVVRTVISPESVRLLEEVEVEVAEEEEGAEYVSNAMKKGTWLENVLIHKAVEEVEVEVEVELASNAMRKATWPESAQIHKVVVEVVEIELASNVVKKVTCHENVQMEVAEEAEETELASNVVKKVICHENAQMEEVVVAEVHKEVEEVPASFAVMKAT